MIDSLSKRARRREFGALLVVFVVTIVTWVALTRAVTYLLVENDWPIEAIGLRPWDAYALKSLAVLAMDRRNVQGKPNAVAKSANVSAAERLAKKALEIKPLDPTTLRILAQLAELQGNNASSEKFMEVAGHQTIRDGIVNVYLLKLHAARGEYAKALERADALLRITPALSASILPIVETIAVNHASRSALVALLQEGPPWRAAFLADIASKLKRPEDFLDIILALKDGPCPLKNAELRAYLEPQIARGLVDQAYDTWLRFLPSKQLSSLYYVNNGDFKDPPTDLPFDWTINSIEGASTTVDDSPDQGRRGLHIVFDGRRVPFRNVVQMLKLPAGKFRLSGSYWSNALINPRGMTWRIYCAERIDSTPIAETDRVSGQSGGWKAFETDFEIPSDRCRAQWLRLELASRISVEELVSGEVWYDYIKITKSEGNHKAPVTAGIRMPEQPGTPFERAIRAQ